MVNKKKIILFDIDYTLFNAQQFRESFFEVLIKNIQPEERQDLLRVLEDVYEETKEKTSFFDPKLFLELLDKKIALPHEIATLEKSIMQQEILESALYFETKEVLERLSKEPNIVLGILSWGNIPTQNAKIQFLENYLEKEHIHVVEVDKRKVLPEILKTYEDYTVYLIDDYQEVLSIAKQAHPDIHTVWIKRPEIEGKSSRIFDNFVPDSIISTLKEVIPLVVR